MPVFDKGPVFIFAKQGHCDIVWYVESYKRLVLNSICKINSPGQKRREDSYKFVVPFCLPPSPELSSSFSHCSLSLFIFKLLTCSFFPCIAVLHNPYNDVCMHLRGISQPSGRISEGERGGSRTSWGSLQSVGQGQFERSEVKNDGCSWHRPQGMCVCVCVCVIIMLPDCSFLSLCPRQLF